MTCHTITYIRNVTRELTELCNYLYISVHVQNEVFPAKEQSSEVQRLTVNRAGVVTYKDKTVVVKYEGKTQQRFRNIEKLQVHNRIEGYLDFFGSASPRTRVFPGYGEPLVILLQYYNIILLKCYQNNNYYRVSASWRGNRPVLSDLGGSKGTSDLQLCI